MTWARVKELMASLDPKDHKLAAEVVTAGQVIHPA
jgi:hypothetical protein